MSLINCFDKAQTMGVLTLEEARHFKKRFRELSAEISNSAKVRARLVKEVESEAKHRERAAVLTEVARMRIETSLRDYRNLRGEVDLVEAFKMLHENFGRAGSFVQDAEGRRDTIMREAMSELQQVMHEFRRGAITGDLRRSRAPVQMRMDNFVRELFGEATGDATAAAMARAWETSSEKLRVRINGAGAAIAKLDRWGLPQGHDALALMAAGRDPWISYMMGDGVLDRERTVHPVSRLKLTDADLRESLSVIWDRITTDGWSDRDLTATAGKGAIYTQHADHRFLHFKNADAWLAYAKLYGNPDAFSAIMSHVGTMARDIAHMEVFGPNPNRIREYIKNLIRAEAAKLPPAAIVAREIQTKIDDLQASAARLTAATDGGRSPLDPLHPAQVALSQLTHTISDAAQGRQTAADVAKATADLQAAWSKIEASDEWKANAARVEIGEEIARLMGELTPLPVSPIGNPPKTRCAT